MSAAIQGSEESSVEAETSDGSTFMVIEETVVVTEKSTDVAPGSTKANNFRVPVYASQYCEKMKSLGTQTIKEMISAACARNTAEPPDMHVPPPFTPPCQKAGEGAKTKSSSMVLRKETEMETDATPASTVQSRPPVPPRKPATHMDKIPCLVDEASMKKWSNDMLKGHPDGRATTSEQWSNSFPLQFKGFVDTMSQPLRIKEDAYSKQKVVIESRGNIKKISIVPWE